MPMTRRTFHSLSAAVAASCAAPITSFAQPADRYPAKPIRIVVPVTAGGSTDSISRLVAERASAKLGQAIVIDNRPGAGGMVGAEIVEQAAPDGYTLLMAYASFALAPHLFRTQRYSPLAFVPVTQLASQPIAIVANPAFVPKTLPELIAWSKANPGRLQVGIAAAGSSGHVALEQARLVGGLDATPVIYKGAAPNLAAVMGGEVLVSFTSTSAALPLAKAGRLRFIANLTPQRLKQVPEVPTALEGGVNLVAAGWTGLVGPPKMPQAIVERLHAAFAEVLHQPDTVERLALQGAYPLGNSPAEFRREIEREFQEFKAVVEKSGMKPD